MPVDVCCGKSGKPIDRIVRHESKPYSLSRGAHHYGAVFSRFFIERQLSRKKLVSFDFRHAGLDLVARERRRSRLSLAVLSLGE